MEYNASALYGASSVVNADARRFSSALRTQARRCRTKRLRFGCNDESLHSKNSFGVRFELLTESLDRGGCGRVAVLDAGDVKKGIALVDQRQIETADDDPR